MSKRKTVRFLKKIVIFNFFMCFAIDALAGFIAYRNMYMDSGYLLAMLSPWGIEGILTALLEIYKGKEKKEEKSSGDEGSI